MKMTKICIDPGHAKNTAGKRSPDGTLMEYEFNRDVAKRLKVHLERHGITVFYSCDIEAPDDTPLAYRTAKANREKSDLYISIHANAGTGGWDSANGWEAYYYAGSTKGRMLADSIRKESIALLGLKDRGIKTNSMYVTSHTNMPAVLIEHGFYTNKTECELLKTVDFREKCAIADSKGILSYLGVAWKDAGSANHAQAAPSELITPSEIVAQLSVWGIVQDQAGMLAEMEQTPNSRLYWLARKAVAYIKKLT